MEITKIKFETLYPLYVAKAQRKNRTQEEVDEILYWLTGYTQEQVQQHATQSELDMEQFFSSAPSLNPKRELITGSICGVKIAEMPNGIEKEIRCLDKLIDELAKGKAMEKILRG